MVRFASLVLVLSFVVSAQDWPQFRGPESAGHGAGAGIPLVPTLKEALFRTTLPGKGHSSPVVVGGRVFLTAETGEGKRVVVALDGKKGDVLWTYEVKFEPHAQHRFNSFASATLAADAERVYACWTSGNKLRALALTVEGKLVFERELGANSAQHGSGASPVVVDGVLLIGNDHEVEGSFVCGLDAGTGKELWKHERVSSRASYATPLILREEGKPASVIFASTSHGLTCLDPKTGAKHWETGPVFKERCVGGPAVAGSMLFAAAGSGGGGKEAVLLRLPGGDVKEAAVVERPRKALPYVPTPLGVGNRFFLLGDGGVLTWMSADDAAVVWRERLPEGFYASPVLAGDRIWVVSREGTIFVLAAKDEYALLGQLALAEPCSATPAIANGCIYVRTERTLFAFGKRD